LLPELAALVAVTVALDFAQAVESEQSRVLGKLVGRRAFDRVLDVATRVDLLAFEEPDFFDRLARARAQGMFRSLQLVNGLLGIAGGAVAAVGIVGALTALQPLLLPLVALGYIPLSIVAARNTRDLYKFMYGMTPNEREREYLRSTLTRRGTAKEVRAFGIAGFLRSRYDRLYDSRIDGRTRRARREPALRANPGPARGTFGAADLAPVLQRTIRRPDVRPRRGARARARDARGADGCGRPRCELFTLQAAAYLGERRPTRTSS
jgi:ATP-binding cassette, subfamily B, bacterial